MRAIGSGRVFGRSSMGRKVLYFMRYRNTRLILLMFVGTLMVLFMCRRSALVVPLARRKLAKKNLVARWVLVWLVFGRRTLRLRRVGIMSIVVLVLKAYR